jgi:hypothetical protein
LAVGPYQDSPDVQLRSGDRTMYRNDTDESL